MEGPLTAREMEVALLIRAGLPSKRIAAQLGLSVHTVEKHVENAAAKLPNPDKLRARSVIITWLIRAAA